MRFRRYSQRNFQNSCKTCVGLQRLAILAMPRCKIAATFRSQNARTPKVECKFVVVTIVARCFTKMPRVEIHGGMTMAATCLFCMARKCRVAAKRNVAWATCKGWKRLTDSGSRRCRLPEVATSSWGSGRARPRRRIRRGRTSAGALEQVGKSRYNCTRRVKEKAGSGERHQPNERTVNNCGYLRVGQKSAFFGPPSMHPHGSEIPGVWGQSHPHRRRRGRQSGGNSAEERR